MMNLYDASAMVNAVLRYPDRAGAFFGEAILDLTAYEVGNAIRNICRRREKTVDEAANLLGGMLTIMQGMVPLRVAGLEQDVLTTSNKRGLSYYDAAYLVVATKEALTLVTDDHKLADAARLESISVVDGSTVSR